MLTQPSLLPPVVNLIFSMGIERSWRTIHSYPLHIDALKKAYWGPMQLKETAYYSVAMLATLEQCRGQGLASRYIRYVQGLAKGEGVPVWLETSTGHARELYIRLGFKEVGLRRCGVGLVGNEGWRVRKGRSEVPEQDGHGKAKEVDVEAIGARLWGMVWWPEGVQEVRA